MKYRGTKEMPQLRNTALPRYQIRLEWHETTSQNTDESTATEIQTALFIPTLDTTNNSL